VNSEQQTQRYFIALLPPDPIQVEVTAIKEYCKATHNTQAALRSPPHITLQAPFEWPLEAVADLKQCLAEFVRGRSSFPLSLSGFDAFPPRVIFIAVDPSASLLALQKELSHHLERQLQIVDPKARTRSFHPHMTVAFRDLKPKQFKRAWPEFQERSIRFEFIAEALTLLIHTGKEWIVESHFAFASHQRGV
jgi:2'-5' RNA ligase